MGATFNSEGTDHMEYEVNVDRGIEHGGKHLPLGSFVAMSDSDAAPLVKKGWLVPVPEKKPLPPVPFVNPKE